MNEALPLLAESLLVPYLEQVRLRMASELQLSDQPQPGREAEALAWAMLFEHWPYLLGDVRLNARALFYNRYFWFQRYRVLHQQRAGDDAGLAQQAFQLLEQAPAETNWDVMEKLEQIARQVAQTTVGMNSDDSGTYLASGATTKRAPRRGA
jgi:hypothetical protein